jgi:hypothetical protein
MAMGMMAPLMIGCGGRPASLEESTTEIPEETNFTIIGVYDSPATLLASLTGSDNTTTDELTACILDSNLNLIGKASSPNNTFTVSVDKNNIRDSFFVFTRSGSTTLIKPVFVDSPQQDDTLSVGTVNVPGTLSTIDLYREVGYNILAVATLACEEAVTLSALSADIPSIKDLKSRLGLYQLIWGKVFQDFSLSPLNNLETSSMMMSLSLSAIAFLHHPYPAWVTKLKKGEVWGLKESLRILNQSQSDHHSETILSDLSEIKNVVNSILDGDISPDKIIINIEILIDNRRTSPIKKKYAKRDHRTSMPHCPDKEMDCNDLLPESTCIELATGLGPTCTYPCDGPQDDSYCSQFNFNFLCRPIPKADGDIIDVCRPDDGHHKKPSHYHPYCPKNRPCDDILAGSQCHYLFEDGYRCLITCNNNQTCTDTFGNKSKKRCLPTVIDPSFTSERDIEIIQACRPPENPDPPPCGHISDHPDAYCQDKIHHHQAICATPEEALPIAKGYDLELPMCLIDCSKGGTSLCRQVDQQSSYCCPLTEATTGDLLSICAPKDLCMALTHRSR